MKRGFTLIELAIVIIIVGLLIGGILAGQSLIRWSKLQSLQIQTTQLGILVSQFKLTYGSIPGEYTHAATSFPQIFDNSKGATYCPDGSGAYYPPNGFISDSYESEAGWAELEAAGMLQMGRPQTFANGTQSTKWLCYSGSMTQGAAMATRIENLYGVWAYIAPGAWGFQGDQLNGLNFGAAFTPAMTGADALALDKKFDDGLPMTGLVKAGNTVNGSGNCTYDAGGDPTINTYNNRYLDLDKFTCQIQLYFPTYNNTN